MSNISTSEICCVIVTYGDRFKYLSEVLNALIEQQVQKILIIDNASDENSRRKLEQYRVDEDTNIRVINKKNNIGSAGGYKLGIEKALEDENVNYIWLLDDDNKPLPFAFKNIIKSYESISCVLDKFCLVSYRKVVDENGRVCDKKQLYESVFGGRVLGKKINIWKKLISTRLQVDEMYPLIERYTASFGGLFMSKNLILEIGLPRDDFFLYADDTEYSQRMRDKKYKIFTAYSSQILDVVNQNHSTHSYLSFFSNDIQVYYSIRNHLYVSLKKSTNIEVFKQYVKLLIQLLTNLGFVLKNMKFARSRVRLVLRAIRDGKNGNLGKTL